jgi:hypothetical protein
LHDDITAQWACQYRFLFSIFFFLQLVVKTGIYGVVVAATVAIADVDDTSCDGGNSTGCPDFSFPCIACCFTLIPHHSE